MNNVKFATHQLSKKEMNQLKGGEKFYCKCHNPISRPKTGEGDRLSSDTIH